MDEYEAGYFTYYSGKPCCENPYQYRAQPLKYIRWETGWWDAKDNHDEALESCHKAYQVSNQPDCLVREGTS